MQTSFMHPPFGVALFYIRGIAPPSVKTSDIYLGAIPWIVMQLVVVVVVAFWPESVTYWISEDQKLDSGTVERKLESMELQKYD
jgi:TRAP-type mannitol/chloroaromatic compound transport system permease large subunit